MKVVKVLFEDGNNLVTGINGTVEQILAYYVGKIFNVGRGAEDYMVKAVAVVFLE